MLISVSVWVLILTAALLIAVIIGTFFTAHVSPVISDIFEPRNEKLVDPTVLVGRYLRLLARSHTLDVVPGLANRRHLRWALVGLDGPWGLLGTAHVDDLSPELLLHVFAEFFVVSVPKPHTRRVGLVDLVRMARLWVALVVVVALIVTR